MGFYPMSPSGVSGSPIRPDNRCGTRLCGPASIFAAPSKRVLTGSRVRLRQPMVDYGVTAFADILAGP